ncbi:peptide deformylase [Patescibacteria group bacterium]|nr:peptide deformylase [Patescibacteria group bacterium]
MIKKVLTYNSKKLREKSQPIKKLDRSTMQLIKNLVDTLRCSDGVGLSAPQIGNLKRVLVYEYKKPKNSTDKTPDLPLTVLINPEIIKTSAKTEISEEGCLSFPNMFGQVERFKKITVQTLGINNKEIKFEAKNLEARIIQHELDHLDGILFVDRLINPKQIYTYQI